MFNMQSMNTSTLYSIRTQICGLKIRKKPSLETQTHKNTQNRRKHCEYCDDDNDDQTRINAQLSEPEKQCIVANTFALTLD